MNDFIKKQQKYQKKLDYFRLTSLIQKNFSSIEG